MSDRNYAGNSGLSAVFAAIKSAINEKVSKINGKDVVNPEVEQMLCNKPGATNTYYLKANVNSGTPTYEWDTEKFDVSESTVRAAYKLLSETPAAESVPYVLRRSGGLVRDVALENLKKIVGASVAWNQVAYDNLSFSGQGITITNTNGIIDIDGTATGNVYMRLINDSDRPIADHIYYVSTKNKQSGVIVYNNNNGITTSEKTAVIGKDVHGVESQDWYLRIAVGTVCQHLKMAINIIDLTKMFGTAIADYLYSLEQATAGSGIAKLKEWGFLTKDYYAYNAGNLLSVKTSGKKVTCKNQLPTTVASVKAANRQGTWNGNVYTFNNTTYELLTDESNVNIYSINVNTGSGGASATSWLYMPFTLSAGSYIMNGCPSGGSMSNYIQTIRDVGAGYSVGIMDDSGNGSTFTLTNELSAVDNIRIASGYVANNLIFKPMIRFASIADSSFEPYIEKIYPLSNVELRGLFKLDDNNKLYADGDEYTPDGNVKRKYGIVNLGSLEWTYNSGDRRFNAPLATIKSTAVRTLPMECSRYEVIDDGRPFADLPSYCIYNNGPAIAIHDDRYTDAATFTTAVTGQYLVYPLATPIIDTTTLYAETMLVDGNGTEEFLDTRDVPIPVGHESEYSQQVAELPSAPTNNGNYKLRCTVSSGVPTYSWVSDS